MKWLSDWPTLVDQGISVVGLEFQSPDRARVLRQFHQWGDERSLPVYLWNPGLSGFQKLVWRSGKTTFERFQDCLLPDGAMTMQYLLDSDLSGIVLLEGALQRDEHGEVCNRQSYQLLNAYYQSEVRQSPQYWVLLEDTIQLPIELQPYLPILGTPLPTRLQIQAVVQGLCRRFSALGELSESTSAQLVRSCQGLSIGEVEMVISRMAGFAESFAALAESISLYKISKLKDRGLEFISDPDVPTAGGLEVLEEELSKVVSLLDPAAERLGLKFPKGMILWGPPGTGKSLSAKLAAKKMGVPLLALDWGQITGTKNPDRVLRNILSLAEALSPVVCYFDDFDKAFANFDSNSDGGLGRRMAGKLLTWMQEHQYPIYMIATVNRLGMLPAELIRRFDDIFFCALPTEGARYEIFKLHLSKYFPDFRHPMKSPFSEMDWRLLLRDYKICTPAEIGKAVRKTAETIYHRRVQQGLPVDSLTVTLKDLQEQRWKFTPAMVREEKQMYEILNQATFARNSAGEDRSIFAIPPQELFGDVIDNNNYLD
ncbi:AAA family ATPase [Leptolyngbya sp. AN03gr2]|uniref:AAA family ATPase n=1 Tax=unclassified Leptolyngbya TaxID=2650499 RepID=UPI003D3153A3